MTKAIPLSPERVNLLIALDASDAFNETKFLAGNISNGKLQLFGGHRAVHSGYQFRHLVRPLDNRRSRERSRFRWGGSCSARVPSGTRIKRKMSDYAVADSSASGSGMASTRCIRKRCELIRTAARLLSLRTTKPVACRSIG